MLARFPIYVRQMRFSARKVNLSFDLSAHGMGTTGSHTALA